LIRLSDIKKLMKNIEQIQWTKRRLETSAFILFIQYLDYNTAEWKVIKKELAVRGLQLKVIKTSRIKKSLEGTSYSLLSQLFNGPTAIVFADEKVSFDLLNGAVNLLIKEEKIQIISGIYKDQILFPSKINELISLPNQEKLLSKGLSYLQNARGSNVVQTLDNTLTSSINLLNQSPNYLVNLFSQIKVSKEYL
jgi:large subunit ribosomal protein L10